MKKRQVLANKIFYAEDFNYGQSYTEYNLQNIIKDLGYDGFVLGGSVTEDSPTSWSVFLESSVIYNNSGNRIYVSTSTEIDFTATVTAAGNPGTGNEYYLTAYIEHAYAQSVPYSGTSVYRIIEDSYTISFKTGVTATTGNAVKPTLTAGQYCICDILITPAIYTGGVILQAYIDMARQATQKSVESSDTATIDNELVRWDGTTGKVLQGTGTTPPTLSDTGILTINNTTDASSLAAAAQLILGGLAVTKKIIAGTNILVTTDANLTDFPNATLVSSKGNSGHTYTYNIGIVGEALAAAGAPSIGVGGVAKGYDGMPSYGVAGRGIPETSASAGAAVGVEGLAEATHAGGSNIGFWASATNGALNYSFYGNAGNFYNNGTGLFVGALQAPSLSGGAGSGGNLTLYSTSHATKGKILFGTSAYDEVNNYLGIATANPSAPLHIISSGAVYTGVASLLIVDASGRATLHLKSTSANPSEIVMMSNNVNKWWLSARASPYNLNFYGDAAGSGSPSLIASLTVGGRFLVGTEDSDGTPAVGKITAKGSTTDGSTLIFVGRDSAEANVFTVDTDGNVSGNNFRSLTSVHARYYHIPLFSANPGASGATLIPPDANTAGGWRLTNAAHILYGESDVHADWDGATDLVAEIKFECNVNNTGGGVGDTVDLKLVAYYKGVGDIVTKTQTVEVPTTIGQSAQYKKFKAVFTLDWDAASNVIEVGDGLKFILNLETDTSEVDDIIVTSASIYYKTTHVGIELGDV